MNVPGPLPVMEPVLVPELLLEVPRQIEETTEEIPDREMMTVEAMAFLTLRIRRRREIMAANEMSI